MLCALRAVAAQGTDYLPTLLQLVDAESLPSQLGGKSIVHDMKVRCSAVRYGGACSGASPYRPCM